jgi:glycine/D-amino acid oxidase-like deaminating enzyme
VTPVRPVRTGAVDRCLWTQDAAGPRRDPVPPPDAADVVVVGGGYTGLSAARTLALGGARVVVLERHAPGWGASGRNGGFVLPGYQPGLAELRRRHGDARAAVLFGFSLEAMRFLEKLIAEESIACDYRRCGAVTLADRPSHLGELEEEQRALRALAGHETVLLDRRGIAGEIGSEHYHGGLVDPAAASLHPARYCEGLARAAERAGAVLVEGAEVRRVKAAPPGFEVESGRGVVRAGALLVASNGYTGPPFHRLRRGVIPIGSYIVATAPLEPSLASRLVPGGRVLSDTRHLLHYFRLSPDRRMVFGGRTSFTPIGTARSARLLGRVMGQVFPELRSVPVDFAWSGTVGFTRDRLPHAGRVDGIHYALGYCGHGVALATWLGARMGDAIGGRGVVPELGDLPRIPLYGGRPWFLPFVGTYYRMLDWLS